MNVGDVVRIVGPMPDCIKNPFGTIIESFGKNVFVLTPEGYIWQGPIYQIVKEEQNDSVQEG